LHTTAEFIISAAGSGDFPRDGLPEVALIGRSNVGKSTLINTLVGRRVARTSAAPGKTRLANVYRVRAVGAAFYLVDLPGYGYTGGGAAARQAFDALTRAYFSTARPGSERPGPAHVLLLVDARHPGLDSDRSARRWLDRHLIPLSVVATKLDKLTRSKRPRACADIEAALEAPVVPVSSVTGEGLKTLWTLILAQARRA
jgi:GTP-binding protein